MTLWNKATWLGAQGKFHQIVMWYALRYLPGSDGVGKKPWTLKRKENNG